jgi:thioredoxin-like negative regulator of GroEL
MTLLRLGMKGFTMQNDPHAAQLSQAWAMHRQGKQREAADAFGQILKAVADHADALYGLGLVQRALGQKEDARKSFERCHAVIEAGIKHDAHSNRLHMLDRMTRNVSQKPASHSPSCESASG